MLSLHHQEDLIYHRAIVELAVAAASGDPTPS